jgi:hypothetical protein
MIVLLENLARLPKMAVMFISILIVAAFGYIEYIATPDLSFIVFYLIPIFMASWFVGRAGGFVLPSRAPSHGSHTACLTRGTCSPTLRCPTGMPQLSCCSSSS